MGRRVFDSYHAPDSEIEGVKKALDDASIQWYETHKGRWWLGSAGIWISDDRLYNEAREVIDRFQRQWKYDAVTQSANHGINWVKVPAVIIVTGLILYLMLFWFWIPG